MKAIITPTEKSSTNQSIRFFIENIFYSRFTSDMTNKRGRGKPKININKY